MYDLTKEQISSYLSPFSDLLARSKGYHKMKDVICVAVGMCGIRHAAFMADIPLNLLCERIHLPLDQYSLEHWYNLSRFITGACNLWEMLLKTDRVREKSFVAA